MSPEANNIIIIFAVALIIPLCMVVLFIIFNNQKNKLIKKGENERVRFEKELAKSEIETKEAVLKNISWELHDNIGQLMTLAKIKAQNAESDPSNIKEASKIIGTALKELRELSRSINPETLNKKGFLESIKIEIDRFNRMKFIDASLEVMGEYSSVVKKDEIILFRILQEFFNNTIKHARATQLMVKITFNENQLIIEAKDNGMGFEKNNSDKGMGLNNMKNRAKLLGSDFNIDSIKDSGTTMKIIYPLK